MSIGSVFYIAAAIAFFLAAVIHATQIPFIPIGLFCLALGLLLAPLNFPRNVTHP